MRQHPACASSRLEGWHLIQEITEEHEVRREMNLVVLLGEKDPVVAAKNFFLGSIRQLKEELTAFKEDHPELLWAVG
jgi:hypothetical protein